MIKIDEDMSDPVEFITEAMEIQSEMADKMADREVDVIVATNLIWHALDGHDNLDAATALGAAIQLVLNVSKQLADANTPEGGDIVREFQKIAAAAAMQIAAMSRANVTRKGLKQ